MADETEWMYQRCHRRALEEIDPEDRSRIIDWEASDYAEDNGYKIVGAREAVDMPDESKWLVYRWLVVKVGETPQTSGIDS